MPEQQTVKRARRDKREGKSPSTQAGEFVHEEIEHVRHGKHGARSTKQAIAIGLSKARRAGVDVKSPKKGTTSARTRHKAKLDSEHGREAKEERDHKRPSARRSRAVSGALRREGHNAASSRSLSRQARSSARKRTAAQRSAAAKRAARTKGPAERSAAARKAARTRAKNAAA